MLDRENVGRVNSVMADEFELENDALLPDAALYEELGLDSLDSVDLVVALEKAFGFKVVRTEDEERIRAIRTMNDLYSFVEYKLG